MTQLTTPRPIIQSNPTPFPQPKQASEGPGILGAIGAAISTEWAGAWLLRSGARNQIEDDPDYRPSIEDIEQLGEGIDPGLWGAFSGARSADEAQLIREQMLDVQDKRNQLRSLGYGGVALQLGAAVLDPTFILAAGGATAISGGAGGLAAVATKGNRLRRLATAGFIAGAAEGGVESYIVSQDPERDAMGILYAALGAGTFAGVGTELTTILAKRRAMLDKMDEAKRALELEEVIEEGAELTEEGKQYFAVVKNDDGVRRLTEGSELDEDDVVGFIVTSDDLQRGDDITGITDEGFVAADEFTGSLNAQQRDALRRRIQQRRTIKAADRLDLGRTDPDRPVPRAGEAGTRWDRALSMLRFSMAGTLARSQSNTVREAAIKLADDTLAHLRGLPVRVSASEWRTRQLNRATADFYRDAEPAFKSWLKTQDQTGWRDIANRREDFFELVTQQIRFGNQTNADVIKVAKNIQRQQGELLELARNMGVKGFDEVTQNDQYIMRMPSMRKIRDLYARGFTEEQLAGMLSRALMAGSDEVEQEVAERIGRGYLKRLEEADTDRAINRALGREGGPPRSNVASQEQIIREVLEEEGVDPRVIEDLLFDLNRGRASQPGTPPRAKRRVRFDEGYEEVVDGQTLRFDDLTENNAESLFLSYADQMYGTMAGNEFLASMGVESFETLAKRMVREGASDRELARVEALYRNAVGLRIGSTGRFAEAARLMRGFQYLRVMNQVGFAQLAEIPITIAEVGFRTAIESMPALKGIFRNAQDGRLSNQLLREIEAIWGSGTDVLRNQPMIRFDGTDTAFGQRGTDFEFNMRRAQRFVTRISGFAAVDTALQRWSMIAGMNKWADIARTGKVPSERRLMAIGLDQKMAARITKQIQRHSSVEAGALGGAKMNRLNLDDWTDKRAAAMFVESMQTWSRRTVQQNDIGQMSLWMTSDLGKTLIQFRSFVISAWEKQLLYGLSNVDVTTAQTWLMTSVAAGMAYTAQQYINSIGRPDAEEFRREKLSEQMIARAAFARAGWTSLMPGAIDFGLLRTGRPGLFSGTRSTQLATDLFAGNPTIDFVDNLIGGGIKAFLGPPLNDEYDFSQRDFKDIYRLLPFSNAFGVQSVMDNLSANVFDLPERSRDN